MEASKHEPLAVGASVHGRYLVEAVREETAAGWLYDARDDLTDDRLALLVLHPELVADREAAKAFLRAASRARALRHPSLLGVYDVNVSPEGHYLAVEHVEGGNLRAWTLEAAASGGGVHPGTACAIVLAVLDALAAAHDAGIPHGALDAESVVLVTDPTGSEVDLRVRGFGIAAVLPGANADPVPADDAFAAATILRSLLDAAPADADPLPMALDDLLGKALHDDPAERFPDAAALRTALDAAKVLPPAGPPAGLTGGWSEECLVYSDEAIEGFRKLLDEEIWEAPADPWCASGTLTADHVSTGLRFVLVPEGEFLMGCDEGHKDEKPAHRVRVPAFLMCATPCTQEAWDRFEVEDHRLAHGPDLPIEQVCQVKAMEWAEPIGLRLPSEAEWEYACRAGSAGHWCFGDDHTLLGEYAWFRANAEERTHAVGGKKPNAWGLFDVHGNVWEWCEDARHKNYEDAPDDGSAWASEDEDERFRVMRGGSYFLEHNQCRCSYREWKPDRRLFGSLGFRPAASLP